MNKHLELSSFICSTNGCTRRIKKSIIDKKKNTKTFQCFPCFMRKQEKRNHTMQTAKDIRNNIALRSKKRSHLPLKQI